MPFAVRIWNGPSPVERPSNLSRASGIRFIRMSDVRHLIHATDKKINQNLTEYELWQGRQH